MVNKFDIPDTGQALRVHQPFMLQAVLCVGMVYVEPWEDVTWITLPCFQQIERSSFICEKGSKQQKTNYLFRDILQNKICPDLWFWSDNQC